MLEDPFSALLEVGVAELCDDLAQIVSLAAVRAILGHKLLHFGVEAGIGIFSRRLRQLLGLLLDDGVGRAQDSTLHGGWDGCSDGEAIFPGFLGQLKDIRVLQNVEVEVLGLLLILSLLKRRMFKLDRRGHTTVGRLDLITGFRELRGVLQAACPAVLTVSDQIHCVLLLSEAFVALLEQSTQ